MVMATFLVLIGITYYHTVADMDSKPAIPGNVETALRRARFASPSQMGRKIGERGSIYIRYGWGPAARVDVGRRA